VAAPTAGQSAHQEIAVARNRQLTWWAFKKHRLAGDRALGDRGALRHLALCRTSLPPPIRAAKPRAVYHPPQMIRD
jgi:hypothetical protein